MRSATPAVLALALLTGCTAPAPAPPAMGGFEVIVLTVESHDDHDFEANYVAEVVVDAIVPPGVPSVFQDANGNPVPFPGHHRAPTPINIPIYYRPGVAFSISFTAYMQGKWGDAVVCYVRDAAGNMIPSTRTVGAVFDVPREEPHRIGRTQATCYYSVTP